MRMTNITILKNSCLILTLLLCIGETDQANVLRGNDGKNNKAHQLQAALPLHPKLLSEDYRGKTWTDLGVDFKAVDEFRQKRRNVQSSGLPDLGSPTYSYFVVSCTVDVTAPPCVMKKKLPHSPPPSRQFFLSLSIMVL
jgi:hypothetical protein